MKQVNTLSSIEGRNLLYDIFYELRYERQLSGMSVLFTCWRICTYENELKKYISNDVEISHPLGLFAGTSLWMEEIVNRFYYSTINSFVYFGAAVLLVLIGVRRFSDQFSDNLVIAGVLFEAAMLIVMFVVMLFSPNEEIKPKNGESKNGSKNSDAGDLIYEIGELSRDLADVVIKLENIAELVGKSTETQDELLKTVGKAVTNLSAATAPNPEMIEIMKETNTTLLDFKNTVCELTDTTKSLRKDEIEYSVRKEVEKLILDKLNGNR
jgi:hypothetical protein